MEKEGIIGSYLTNLKGRDKVEKGNTKQTKRQE